MKKLLAILILLGASQAYAATDYNCMRICMANGYLMGLCQQQCSY